MSAGIQYCRMSSPIGVPGPTLVRISDSGAVVIYLSLPLGGLSKGALALLLKAGIKPAAATMPAASALILIERDATLWKN